MAVHLDYSIVYLDLVAQVGRASLADALHEDPGQLLCEGIVKCLNKRTFGTLGVLVSKEERKTLRKVTVECKQGNSGSHLTSYASEQLLVLASQSPELTVNNEFILQD